MNFVNFFTQLKWIFDINLYFIDIIQILILSFALYYLIKSIYKTRAWILVKGLLIIGAFYIVIYFAEMSVLQTIMQGAFSFLMIAIIIMLQPDLQKIVELIGKKKLTNVKSLFVKKQEFAEWMNSDSIKEIVDACENMSKAKTGALIVIERDIPLKECIDSGIVLDSHISKQLLMNIFEKNTPLHDGAIVIRNNRIKSATCYLPLSSNLSISKKLGTRHRAALGIAESSDCVVIVVSEETGAISFCKGEKIIHDIDIQKLTSLLKKDMRKSDELLKEKRKSKAPLWLKIAAPLLSIVIWFSVIMINDPVIVKTIYNVNVSVVNEDILDAAGHAYTIKDGSKINVKIQGKRSVVDSITKEDILATANLSNMSALNTVLIDIRPNSNVNVEILTTNKIMKLALEDMVQVEVPFETIVDNNLSSDYVAVIKEMEIDTVKITCPESIAKTLDKAVATIIVNNEVGEFELYVGPDVYDKNGNIVDKKKLSLSHNLIRVVAKTYEVKEIPLIVTIPEQNKTGDHYYVLNSYETIDTIRAAITDENVKFDELVVEIVPDENEDILSSAIVNLSKYIPDGVVLAKNQDPQITIKLDLTKFERVSIPISASDINFTNYDTSLFNITVLSMPSTIDLYYNTSLVDVDSINLNTLTPKIKVEQTVAGSYKAKLLFAYIDGVEVSQDLVVNYVLSEGQ